MSPRSLNRWKAATIYLGLSAVIATTIVGLMLLVWYPRPYFAAMGGDTLILLMVGVDVVLGPIIVLIVFNPAKKYLRLDLAIIALFQFAALAYGCYVMSQARPVYNVFTVDRFEVIAANQIDGEALADATLPEFKTLPYAGPRVIAAVLPADPDEQLRVATSAMGGGPDLSRLPHYYVPYAQLAAKAATHAKPLELLAKRQPDQTGAIREFVADSGRREDEMGFLPMSARNKEMSVVVALKSGDVIGILPVYPW
jgi:hypothetical protein